MPRYDYHRPATLEEALALKRGIPGARFVAGGTDLLVQIRKRRQAPPALVSLRGVAGLEGIEDHGRLRIGAATTLAALAAHPVVRARLPALAEAALAMGGVQIRNAGTVGGNLCNASPAADLAPPLLTLDAAVEIRSAGASRELPLAAFLLGPGRTALAGEELLGAVLVPMPAPGVRTAFLRRGRVQMDLAIVSVAALVALRGGIVDRVALAAGAVAPVPLRLARAEAHLQGAGASGDRIAEAARLASGEVSPISDLRAGAGYRRQLVEVFVRRALERCLAEVAG